MCGVCIAIMEDGRLCCLLPRIDFLFLDQSEIIPSILKRLTVAWTVSFVADVRAADHRFGGLRTKRRSARCYIGWLDGSLLLRPTLSNDLW